jgi:hypothetical protein
MASPNTLPTPEAEAHPWDGAIPNIEQVPQAPAETHDSVIQLDPNSKLSISQQIEHDAQTRGFDDIHGLRLEVGSEADGTRQSFVVRDTSIHKEPIKVERSVGLPRFSGGLTTLHRPKKRTVYKKAGMPRFVKYGSLISFERRKERIGDKDVPYVTIDTYDEHGIHKGVKSIRQQDLFATAGELGVTQASWSERSEKPVDTGTDLPIGLSKKKARFEQITDQLEANGVTNWTGLTWQREDPHDIHKPKTTQEIISDASIKERAFNGKDNKWSRVFILRTTTEKADGRKDIEEVRLRDYELWQYLEDERKGTPIKDMRMPGAGTRPRYDAIARDAWDSDQAWGGLVVEHPKRQEWVDAPAQHAMPPTSDALGMLSYPEVYLELYGEEDGKEAIKAHADQLGMRPSEVRYAEELQRTIAELGRDKLDEIVADIQRTYVASLERLGLEGEGPQTADDEDIVLRRVGIEPGHWDYSDSWIIRDLMKKRLENAAENMKPDDERGADVWDPLGDTLEARQFRRDLVDTRIGKRLTAASMRLSEPQAAPTGEVEDNKPVMKERREFIYDNKFETMIPILTNYGQRKTVNTWRSLIWKPVEQQAEVLHRVLASEPYDSKRPTPYPIPDEEYRKLGRGVRRTIGQ